MISRRAINSADHSSLFYDREAFPFPASSHFCTTWLLPACPAPAASAPDIVAQALARPAGSPHLLKLAGGKHSAVILVPGRDRVAGAEIYVPIILETLNAAGIPDSAIRIILATGTHAVHTEADAAAILGADVCRRVSWRQHNCSPGNHLVRLGVTSRGTPVEFDRETVEAGIVILTGRVIPHYFAGFGGGRKALLPGIASRASIHSNHRLTLDSSHGIHPAIRPTHLSGNPVHEDMLEAGRFVSNTFTLNTLLDQDHRLVAAVAGDMETAHAEGCRLASDWFSVPVRQPFDAMISCAGGWPYDCDFVQALKTAFNVQEGLREGGSLLWIAKCPQGIRDSFLQWSHLADDRAMEDAIRANYDLSGHNSILLRKLVRKARIALWSSLPDQKVMALGLTPVHSLAAGLAWLQAQAPAGSRCAVIPYANVTFVTTSLNGLNE